MSRPIRADLPALIAQLLDAEIEFIVVGGAAAVLHGGMAMTADLDIVYSRSERNLDRLMSLLDRLEAAIREPGDRRLRPTRGLLAEARQLDLVTALGPLDPLAQLHDGRDFEMLQPHCEWLTDGRRRVRVLDLPTLIAVKRDAGRAKDRIVLPALLALLERRRRDS